MRSTSGYKLEFDAHDLLIFAQKKRNDALQMNTMIAWKHDHLSSMKSNREATMHHEQIILVKSLFSFRLELEAKRTLQQHGGGGEFDSKRPSKALVQKKCNPTRKQSPYTSASMKHVLEKEIHINSSNRCKSGVTKKCPHEAGAACNKVLFHRNSRNKYWHDKDEVERLSYLEKKRQEKMKQIAKQKELERMKNAWQLAKMHYSICVLQRYFTNSWGAVLQEQKLKMLKAASFFRQNLLQHSFAQLKKNIVQKKNRAFERADNYYCERVCANIMKYWSTCSANSHHVLYHKAERISMIHRKKRLTELWLSHLTHNRMKLLEWSTVVKVKARENILKWTLRRWREGVKMIQLEREEEEKVKAKWNEVRGWLKGI